MLAATHTTQDSGVLDALTQAFDSAYPDVALRVVAVATGEALELGRRGDADLLLVHDSAVEVQFVAAGHGIERRPVMRNSFVLVGPRSDPAGVRGTRDAAAALRRIAGARERFVSRGDDSGTHRRELQLWRAGGLDPQGFDRWYLEAGVGMAETLRVADERRAYVLTDRSTYEVLRDGLELEVLTAGDPRLDNPYALLLVAGAAHPEDARVVADWLTSPAGQRVIERFGVAEHGRPLFEPSAR